MKKFRFYAVVGLTALLACNTFGEEQTVVGKEVSLDTLVTDALANNPELKFYKLEIAVAKGERRTARSLPNPEASFEIGHKRATESPGLSGEGAAWRVSVSQSFDFPGRIALRKAIADQQIDLAQLGLARFKAALAAKVRSVGYRLLIAQEKADAATAAAKRGEELVNVLVQREPAGVSPLLETRIIEANVITLKREAIEAIQDAQAALFDLNQLRGETLASPLRIAPQRIHFKKLPDAENLLASAFTNNFELRARQIELAQQGIKVDLTTKERWSAIKVEPFFSQEKALDKEQIVGVGVSMPLPLWNRNKGNIETAKARQDQAETAVHLARRQVERDVRSTILAYETQLAEINRLSPNVIDQLREAAELGDRHYRLGSLPVATYVELQTQYLEALEAILKTQADALENLQQLELLTGTQLRAQP